MNPSPADAAMVRRRAVFDGLRDAPRALRLVRRYGRQLLAEVARETTDHLAAAWPEVSVVATGGCGRGEVYPGSDLDLLFLTPVAVTAPQEEAVARLLAQWWDQGLRVGHAVVGLDDALERMRADAVTTTAWCEGRWIAGSRTPWKTWQSTLRPRFFAESGDDYLRGRLRQLRARRQFYGASASPKEPNLKESPGGLRDLHEARWVAHALRATGRDTRAWASDAPHLVWHAWDWIARLRARLHLQTGRGRDALVLEEQRALAEWLRFEGSLDCTPAEALMRKTLRAMRVLADVARAAEEAIERALPTAPRARRLGDGLVEVGETLDASDEWCRTPEATCRLLTHAARRKKSLSTVLRRSLRARYERDAAGVETNRACAQEFLRWFRVRGATSLALREAHHIGLLGALLPEFAETDALVREDPYHRWSLDEHLLESVAACDRLEVAADEGMRRTWFDSLARPDLLKLALLLHDLGKTGRGGHVARARVLLPDLLARLDLDVEDARFVSWLVEEHLTLIHAQRRSDLADPDVRRSLCETMGTRDRLRALYLLTVCDSRATSPTALPTWLDALLQETVQGLEADLDGSATATSGRLRRDADDEAWCQRLPRRYALVVDEAMRRTHRRMMGEVEAGASLVHHRADRAGAVEWWWAGRDRPHRVVDLVAALTANRLQVVEADFYRVADADGVQSCVLDRFLLVAGRGSLEEEDPRWRRLEDDLRALEEGERRSKELVASRAPYAEPAPLTSAEIDVRFERRGDATEVAVEAPDRDGLVHALVEAFSECGLTVSLARVATVGPRASDRFIVHGREGAIPPQDEVGVRRAILRSITQRSRPS